LKDGKNNNKNKSSVFFGVKASDPSCCGIAKPKIELPMSHLTSQHLGTSTRALARNKVVRVRARLEYISPTEIGIEQFRCLKIREQRCPSVHAITLHERLISLDVEISECGPGRRYYRRIGAVLLKILARVSSRA
jgi:hypothetical protein